MENTVIVGAKRSPIGSFLGGLSAVSAVKLGAHAIGAAILDSGVSKDQVDEVIMGQVFTRRSWAGAGAAGIACSGFKPRNCLYYRE